MEPFSCAVGVRNSSVLCPDNSDLVYLCTENSSVMSDAVKRVKSGRELSDSQLELASRFP